MYLNSKYLKSITDTSVVKCVEIISVMDVVTTKIRNTIATYLSISSYDKTVRDCFILHIVLLAIMLLLIIIIICYDYIKQNGINALTI